MIYEQTLTTCTCMLHLNEITYLFLLLLLLFVTLFGPYVCNLISESQVTFTIVLLYFLSQNLLGHFISSYFTYLYPESFRHQNQLPQRNINKKQNNNKQNSSTYHSGEKGVGTCLNLIQWVYNNLRLMKSLKILEELQLLIKLVDFVLQRQKIIKFNLILNLFQW